jgi:hypothetical protein
VSIIYFVRHHCIEGGVSCLLSRVGYRELVLKTSCGCCIRLDGGSGAFVYFVMCELLAWLLSGVRQGLGCRWLPLFALGFFGGFVPVSSCVYP